MVVCTGGCSDLAGSFAEEEVGLPQAKGRTEGVQTVTHLAAAVVVAAEVTAGHAQGAVLMVASVDEPDAGALLDSFDER